MAFQVPTAAQHRPSTAHSPNRTLDVVPQTTYIPPPQVQQSQEWILFSPPQAESSTNQTKTTQTVGLSRASDFGTLNTAARSGGVEQSVLRDDHTEDEELDSLDDGLHAFREAPLQTTTSNQTTGAVLPAHDGLGTFQASSRQVQDQLWQHEHFNPKRKYEGHHRRHSSIQRKLDTLEEYELQTNEFKRIRIEKWRIEQSQALLEEVERETRRQTRRETSESRLLRAHSPEPAADLLGTTPRQSDYMRREDGATEHEPFWRRLTRTFIRDIIGIDEPLLSVILGESLPEEAFETPIPRSSQLPTIPEIALTPTQEPEIQSEGWRDRLLQRIARELGVFVHQISPHPGAFTTYSSASNQYAGMPISRDTLATSSNSPQPIDTSINIDSTWTTDLPSTQPIPLPTSIEPSDLLRAERQYWERELDIRMVFRFLKDRLIPTSYRSSQIAGSSTSEIPEGALPHDAARRAAIIRQHHPLVARAHLQHQSHHQHHHRTSSSSRSSPAASRRNRIPISVSVSGAVTGQSQQQLTRRPSSSCASESAKSVPLPSMSSGRNYWDLGGSVGSGSLLASGGMMGGWGEV